MSEELQHPEERGNPSRDLPDLIVCGALVLQADKLADQLDRATREEVILFQLDNQPVKSNTDIDSLTIAAAPKILDGGGMGIAYSGNINFTQPMSDEDIKRMFNTDSVESFSLTNLANRAISIEKIEQYNAYRLVHALGAASVMYLTKSNSQIYVLNTYNGELGGRFYHPAEIGVRQERANFEAFAAGYFHVLDYVATMQKDHPQTRFIRGRYTIVPGVPKTEPAATATGTKTVESQDEHDTVANNRNGISLDEIGGLEQQRDTLRQIAVSYNHPEIMEKWGATRPSGVLLYGPSGTGKTMLITALGNEIGAEVREIQSSDIYDKWLGNSEARIKKIFDDARRHTGRLILFFDEIDAIVGISNGDSGGDAARNNVAGLFKQEMNSLYEDNSNVLVAAAANDLDRIDPSLRRSGRFDYVLGVPLPDMNARLEIISNKMEAAIHMNERNGFRQFDEDINVPRFAELMDGYSGADITEILRRLSFDKAMQEAKLHGNGTVPPISQADIEMAITKFKQS